jgi:tRNA nucleotidyltransferase (CCA-adding enzyme)
MQFLENLPFDLELLPTPCYAVGGAIRDELISRVRDFLDLDIIVETGAIELARVLATKYQAGFVLLDPEYQIARVVFPNMTLDIATQMGEKIDRDLQRRDYTINAIACNIHTHQVIDPLGGKSDLDRRSIRMIKIENLVEDPLRLLRAYRQAAQLNFTIDPQTSIAICQLAPQITSVAAERVLAELRYLLAVPDSDRYLVMAMADGVLSAWLNPQPSSDLASKLMAVAQSYQLITNVYPELSRLLVAPIRETIDISQLAIAKLIYLLPSDRVTVVSRLHTLNVSSGESKLILTAIDCLPRLIAGNLSLTDLYFWFQSVGKAVPLLMILALAQGIMMETLKPIIDRYIDPLDLIAHPTPILTGDDLIAILNIPPSPIIGKLLTAIHLARINGEISDRDDAIIFAKEFLQT